MASAVLCFEPDHPVFAGHFPGRPIVPGVMLLDAAQRTIEAATGLVLAGLAAAKFLSPTLPGEVVALEFDVDGSAVRFEINCGTRKVASGRFVVVPGIEA